MIKSQAEVEAFLRQFMPKLDIWGILFLDRNKNNEALREMGITPNMRMEIIRSIEVYDYIETLEKTFNYGDMWVFGKDYDGTDLYIKLALGDPSQKTICISFHKAEHPMVKPYKKE